MTEKKDHKHQPVFTPNPIAKPLRLFSYVFPNSIAGYLATLWSRPINMGKGLYIPKLKSQANHIINTGVTPIYGYGEGDKHIVLLHGWNARGGQLRKFINPLVREGFCVWWFDAPGFGEHPGKTSNAYLFGQTLIDVQQQIQAKTGQPIYATISHSLGCLATILATNPKLFQPAYCCTKLIWIAPSISPNTMFDSYCEHMSIREAIQQKMRTLIHDDMQIILKEDPWQFFKREDLFDHLPNQTLLMFDTQDEEVLQSDFESINDRIKPECTIKTEGLGHYRMLKDSPVIEQITQFIATK
ncbi:alpha/beta hydrolase [Marinicellulosiphila megalodicopiae]|uniref:alpha/beta hydrolase n=1 Tax=Marinicellulosiphila megalodicopiae TaxID=2724896 RepID=UPI003BAE6AD8